MNSQMPTSYENEEIVTDDFIVVDALSPRRSLIDLILPFAEESKSI